MLSQGIRANPGLPQHSQPSQPSPAGPHPGHHSGSVSTPTARPIVARPTARAIVVDLNGRVLLFQIEHLPVFDPTAPDPDVPRIFWLTPGGGVDPGETFEAAVLRELREETGLIPETLGPCLLDEDFLLPKADRDIHFRIQYFLARVSSSDICLDGLDPAERGVYRDHRWWTAEALAATRETIFPMALPHIVRTLANPECA